MPSKSYAGIGSRETPADVLALMTRIARYLALEGYTLRSGAADGADSAFEVGAGPNKEIYVPWKGFNGHTSTLTPSVEAFYLAASHHPTWGRCSAAAKKLHARNGHQVLGKDLNDPVEFVVCWTKDAKGEGGTGQAIRIAQERGIAVHDLANPQTRAIWEEILEQRGIK